MSEKLTFEETIKKLEEVVKQLESKDISLEQSIEKYQEGLKLSKSLYEMIKAAESLIVEVKS
ncbi:exodeoxyribonuclease VII small subunit [Acholeplasma laidlawii]|uniref:exodeoxyribonuclease VII small subunit n=1 Tax=Acholeplasma laidlawii TaxID=2148 RepID=UPI0018C2303C|nr:exodeoxyribonuclease VII small subunit [Acholeplasma laidlawii]MBG0762676.1 exodeoxyribonuclease VII small subunit [Acholeplasma laidlawii]WIF88973.1 exodeoxyribonuclease VII small subunit [Acholeplasma laidlawii]